MPICSHCATSDRDCVWPDIHAIDTSAAATASPSYSTPSGSVEGLSDRPPTSHSNVIAATTPHSAYPTHSSSSSYQKPRSYSQSQDGEYNGSYASAGSCSHQSSPITRRAFSPDVRRVFSPEATADTRPSLPPPGPVAPTLDYNFPNGPMPDSHNIVDPALAAMYPDMKPKPPIPEAYPTHRSTKSNSVSTASPRIPGLLIDNNVNNTINNHNHSHNSQHSPTTPETVTSDGMLNAGVASTRWLDLLAGDAAEADSGFSLSRRSSRAQPLSHAMSEGLRRLSQERMGPGAARSGLRVTNSRCGVMGRLDWDIPERYPWQEAEDIELRPNEAALFRGFAERSALWVRTPFPPPTASMV